MKQLKKKSTKAFGKKIFLLGQDKDGTNYWMEEPTWDCGWYWGFGYIETYTNNKNPAMAKDVSSHSHFDSMFMNGAVNAYDMFYKFFAATTLTNEEVWQLCDYMKTFYTLKSAAELFKQGNSHYTEKAKIDVLEDAEQVELINEVWLPKVLKRVENLLEPSPVHQGD